MLSGALSASSQSTGGDLRHFGPFEADFSKVELRKFGVRLRLEPKPWQLLVLLLQRPGELVGRSELQRELWSEGTHVDFELGLNVAIRKLRAALSDSAENPEYVETVAGYGYRFIAQVECAPVPEIHPVTSAPISSALRSEDAPDVSPAALAPESVSARINKPREGSRVAKPLTVQSRPRGRPWFCVAPVGVIVVVAILSMIGARYSHRFGRQGLDFQERDWVLISNFENRTGQPVLDGTLEYALQRELSNSQFVNVVPRERIDDALRLMEKPLDTRVDAALGREICLRDGGIRALLTGRVEKVGTVYVLSVNLVDPIIGASVASLSEYDPADSQMAGAVRRLSDRVRETLGEERQLVQKSDVQLEKVMTPSLHALQLYTQADQAIRVDSEQVAIDLLERALQEDPNFASAHLLLGFAYFNSGNEAKGRPEFQRAFELADSVTDRERFFILGSYYSAIAKDPQKSIGAYESLLRLYPDHYWGANNLWFSYVMRERWREAVDFHIRRAELNPSDLEINVRAVWGKAISQQDWGGAQQSIDRVNHLLGLQGDKADPFLSTYMRLLPVFEDWSHGDIQQAHAKLIQIEDAPTSKNLATFELGVFHLVFGEFRQADKFFHSDKYDADRAQALLLYMRGKKPRLKPPFPADVIHMALGDSVQVLDDGAMVDPRSPIAIYMLQQGLVTEVAKSLRKARSDGVPAPITEGQLALARGDTAKAIPSLEGGLRAMLPWPMIIFFQGTDSLARAYEKKDKLADALRILKQAADERGRTYSFPWGSEGLQLMWQRNQLQLADLYRKMGRVTEAEKVEDELSQMLIYADSDHPIVRALQERQHRQEMHPSQPAGQ